MNPNRSTDIQIPELHLAPMGHTVLSKASKTFHAFPRWLWVTTLVLVAWGATTANPILTPVAVLVPIVCGILLWRPGEPPVLVFACAMQWLQAASVIFYVDLYGISLSQAGGPEFERATWLSLGAIVALTAGMRLALLRSGPSRYALLRNEALRTNIGAALAGYLSCFSIAVLAQRFAWDIPALTQVIYALITLKWCALFILAYCIVEQQKGYLFLGLIAVVEVAIGLLGFFAGFKSVFFVLFVVALTSPFALRGRRLTVTLLLAITLFCMGTVWSAIKSEYREFLNQGTDQQVVTVSVDESAGKLGDLLSNLTWDNFMDGLDAMLLRVGYVRFFALTLINVPDAVPYENGALWAGAVKHVVTPRLFFPDKGTISDSERTTLYTGVLVAGEEQGTSIGIGYVAESYVDFGPIWMFAPIFLLGAFFGIIYRVFIIHARFKLIGTAIASAILIFGAYTIETSNIKIVGGNVTSVIVLGGLYLALARILHGWLTSDAK